MYVKNSNFYNLNGKIFDLHLSKNNLLLSDIEIVGTDNSATLLSIFSEVKVDHSKNSFVNVSNISITLLKILNNKANKAVVSIRALHRFSRSIRHPNNNYNFNLKCPANSNPMHQSFSHVYYTHDYYCTTCERGKYSLDKGEANVSLARNIQDIQLAAKMTTNKANCIKCPPGGTCENGISSSDNFWGYKNEDSEVSFLPCPEEYCCAKDQPKCLNYSNCNNNRIGTLCGQCKEDYQVDFFSNKCILSAECKPTSHFWRLYIFFAFMYTIIILYLDDIPIIAKKIYMCIWPRVGRESKKETTKENTGRISGIFSVVVAFYQIKQVLTVELNEEYDQKLLSIFNLQIIELQTFQTFCPFLKLDAVEKVILKSLLFFIAMATLVTSIYIIMYFLKILSSQSKKLLKNISTFLVKKEIHNPESHTKKADDTNIVDEVVIDIKPKTYNVKMAEGEMKVIANKEETLPCTFRLYICMIRVVLLNYNALVIMSLKLFNCEKVNQDKILYIQGDVKCFVWW